LPEDILEEITQLAVEKNRTPREIARDLIIEGLRMNALKNDLQETNKQIKNLMAYAEWNQSMVGEVARLVCGDDREKYAEYGKKVKMNYKNIKGK
jgi:hypothetical protein